MMLRLALTELKAFDLESKYPHVVKSIENGDQCLLSGDQINAQQLYQKTIDNLFEMKQEKSLLMAILQKKMGDSYRDLGNKQKAKEYYLHALCILEPLKDEALEIAVDILIINGNMSYISEEYGQAERFYREALQELVKLGLSTRQEQARILRKLGDVYRSLGKNSEAEKCYLDDLAISMDELEIASTMRKLGNIYQAENELVKAKDCYEKALTIKRKYSVDNKMTLVNILNCLGSLYCCLNESVKAIAVLEEARDIIFDKDHLGESNNRYIIFTLKWLARAEYLRGSCENTLKYITKAQNMENLLYPEGNFNEKAQTLYHFGLYYKMIKKHDDAESCLRSALLTFSKKYSSDSPYVKEIAEQLQEVMRARSPAFIESALQLDKSKKSFIESASLKETKGDVLPKSEHIKGLALQSIFAKKDSLAPKNIEIASLKKIAQ